MIKIADHVVDVGPHAGNRGGNIVYEGSFAGLLCAEKVTGRCMKESIPIKEHFRQAKGNLGIVNAILNSLQNVSVDIPTECANGLSFLAREIYVQLVSRI